MTQISLESNVKQILELAQDLINSDDEEIVYFGNAIADNLRQLSIVIVSISLALPTITAKLRRLVMSRMRGIGGSDIAALMGISPWNTAYGVYLDKID